jgi:uncharacterized protein (DUF433 family)
MTILAKQMTILEQANQLLVLMTKTEKKHFIKLVVRDLADVVPNLESSPYICGSEPCLVRTQIPVWVLEQARRLGISEADLLQSYPSLWAEDLTNAWAYVNSHKVEIDQQISDNEKEALTGN